MRTRRANLSLCFVTLLFSACASIGPPQPPSLELPRPPSDLRASRKGDRVTLSWTVPNATTDRQRLHNTGPTRICRAIRASVEACDTPVGEAPAQTNLPPVNASGGSSKQSNTDSLSSRPRARYLPISRAMRLRFSIERVGAPDSPIRYESR